MAWKMSNENVVVGEIFNKDFCDEVGYFSNFYKVIEKRGKTIVIVCQVAAETTGKKITNGVEIRALEDEVIGAPHRVRAYITENNETILNEINAKGYYTIYSKGDTSKRTRGYSCDPSKGRVSSSLLEEILP